MIRDHQGKFRVFKTAKIGAVEPLAGEVEAAKMGVELANQRGF